MKFLNLGCGAARISDHQWTNVDSLFQYFAEDSLERQQLNAFTNYVDADITKPLPFGDNEFDGCLLSHVLEHFDAQEGIALVREIKRVLKPSGVLVISVPDASYFRAVYHEDTKANQMRLFGECLDAGNPMDKFFDAALWFNEHKAILTKDAVWAYLMRAGLVPSDPDFTSEAMSQIRPYMNRRQFSVEMVGTKP